MNTGHDDFDADVVAYVHGELAPDAQRAVAARLVADPADAARYRALAAADAALAEALDTPAVARSRRANGPRLASGWRGMIAAAAVLVVGALFVLSRSPQVQAGRNDFVELRVAPVGGASSPIFTDVELELNWQCRGDGSRWQHLAVIPAGFDDTSAELAQRSSEQRAGESVVIEAFVPLVVTAVLHAPDGTKLPARLAFAGKPLNVGKTPVRQRVLLREFEVQSGNARPYLGGRPGKGEWVEDFRWTYRNMSAQWLERWLPDQPGEWTIELRVECVPPPTPGAWPTFAEPLVVATKVILTGTASAWGEPHDGLQARIVVATGCADIDRAPMALQLRNTSGRVRKYNVIGTTPAKIPQPFHFDLFDGEGARGERWQQRDDVGVVIASQDLAVPHPDGGMRTLIVCPDYWRLAGKRLGDLPGEHLLSFEFHFEPTLWLNTDPLCMGKLRTGTVRVVVPAR